MKLSPAARTAPFVGRRGVPAPAVALATLLVATALSATTAPAAPLLPDLFPWKSASRGLVYGGTFDLDSEPGRVLYRFNVAIPNIGDGPFEGYEVTHPDATQDVYQYIHNDDGSITSVLMATFTDVHPIIGHLHLEGLAQYSLREVVGGDGVGDVVASQLKTSHGVVDSISYDTSLPGAPATPFYRSVDDNPLGVSVGWADLYPKSIPAQRIDVTGVASGTYWLEVSIDPNNLVQESDETNNVTRILVDLDIPGVPEPGTIALMAIAGLATSLSGLRRRRALISKHWR